MIVEKWVVDSCHELNLDLIKEPELFININDEVRRSIDLIVTMGGDGTILWASKQFHGHYIPPLVSFSMGSLGFLCNFTFKEYPEVLKGLCHLHLDHRLRLKLSVTNPEREVFRGNDLTKSEKVMV